MVIVCMGLLTLWGVYRHHHGQQLTPAQVELRCRSVSSLNGRLWPSGTPIRQAWGWAWDGTVSREGYAVDLVFSCQLPDLAPMMMQVR